MKNAIVNLAHVVEGVACYAYYVKTIYQKTNNFQQFFQLISSVKAYRKHERNTLGSQGNYI